jgi:integrase
MDSSQRQQVSPPWEDPSAELADVAAFVARLAADHDRPRTSEARWRTLRLVQREIGVMLSEASAAQIEAWWFGRGVRTAAGMGKRSAATRAAFQRHLSVFMRWLVTDGRRGDNPMDRIPAVRVPRRDPRPADRAEVNRVLATVRGPARRAIVLASELGLRCMEIAALTRADLQHDPDAGWQLWLTRKGGHRLRVDVPAGLAAELAAIPAGIPLVPSGTGEHLTPAGVSRLIGRTFRQAGSPITAHQLRHLAATELLRETGGDIRAVAEHLGHRDLNVTAGYTQPGRGIVTALELRYRDHSQRTKSHDQNDLRMRRKRARREGPPPDEQ